MHHRADDGMAQARAFDMVDTHPLTSEARAAPRSSLMLRMAKLVCQSGEYLCVVRDVSAEGVGLCFFHATPPEPRTILALANGATYPVERIWQGRRRAGYRFASRIDLQEFIHEPAPYASREVRLSLRCGARIECQGIANNVALRDLSRGGAMAESPVQLPVGSRVALTLPGEAPRLADVCWRKGESHGLSFVQPLATGELAALALTLQPFGRPDSGNAVQAA